jgi:flavin-dependent dehydrogenase
VNASQIPEDVDVVVIGAGPAGSTLAAILSKYRPETRVLVVERETFPRHKVGEGLIVDINRVLADMGALEAVENADFPLKHGTTFLWGAERDSTTFLFREAMAVRDGERDYPLEYTWHVDRPIYDQILADCAADHGAEFAFQWSVTELLQEGGRARGVEIRSSEGETRTVRAQWVVDCGGISGPLTRTCATRETDDKLRNIALYGYFRGVGWHKDLQGPPELRRTLILTHPRGWMWVIPIGLHEASVGFVTSLDTWAEMKADRGERLDPETIYREAIKELPEHETLFGAAEMFDHRGDGRLVHTIQEFSFNARPIWQPGWALCGDAAGFVDAILSVGCFVAQTHAQFLAYALASVLDGADEEMALDSYARTVTENLDAFRSITHMFYAYNATRSDWWRDCSSLLKQSALVPDASDRQAFVAFVSGLGARHALYEEAINSFGGMFLVGLGDALFGTDSLFDEATAEDEARAARSIIGRDPVLAVVGDLHVERFALPHTGTGRLRPVARVSQPVPSESLAIAHRLVAPAAMARVVPLFDGERTLSAIARETAQGESPEVWRREVYKLAYRLLRMGALTPLDDASPQAASP